MPGTMLPTMKIALPLALVLVGCASTPPAPPAAPVDVFVSGTHGYKGFRIPALVRALDGTLLAFAEGRRNGLGDAGDVDLVLSTSSDGGRTWSPPGTIADEGADFIGNPAAVVDARGGAITVLLTWKKGSAHEPDIRSGKAPPATIWSVRSTDHGRTFTKAAPVEGLNRALLARGWRWNIAGPGHGVHLGSGRLVVAGNHSASGGKGNAFLGANALLSDDGGRTWRLGAADEAPAAGRSGPVVHPNETAVALLPDGTLVFSTRDEGGPAPATRGLARSSDGGESFAAPFAPDPGLVGPVCQGSLLTASDGILLASLPADPKGRRLLQIRESPDGGATWRPGPTLHEGPAAYSDLVELGPGSFLALVEVDGYRAIRSIPFAR